MNGQLEDLLRRRADRADPEPDADRMLRQVRVLAEQQRRRRRSLAAAGSGVAVVVAVVTLILLVTPGGTGSPNGRQVGGLQASTSTMKAHPAPAPKSVAAISAAGTAAAAGRLVKAGVTPERAPLAVRLIPAGYRYLGAISTATTYGPAGSDRSPSSFDGKVALLVGENYGGRAMPLTLAGHPGRVDRQGSPFGWTATIEWSKTVELAIQVPTAANLSRDQVIRLANSLKVRDVSHVAHG